MRIRKNLVLRHVGKDYVIIEPHRGMVDMANVYTLNDTAAWLWQQLGDVEFTVDDVARLLLYSYDIDQEKALRDAEQLVLDMKQNGLLEE